MSFLSRFIGLVMLLGGFYGLYISIPPFLQNTIFDFLNPLIRLGFIQPSANANLVDVGISFVIFLIGIVLLSRSSKPKVR